MSKLRKFRNLNKNKGLAYAGLFLITFWAAIQYVFLSNIPDSVSTLEYICLTNLIGLLVMCGLHFKKLKSINKGTLKKGLILAIELLGFNVLLIFGSRHVDSVVISSLASMYFVFITPLLLFMKRRVSFRTGVATTIAVIALMLMFGADFDLFFSSPNVLYILLADIFFAFYLVTIDVAGKNEDPTLLSICQMICMTVLSFAGWFFEVARGKSSFSLHLTPLFVISLLFIGIFIRALYSVIQMKSQQYVAPINASLIISSEIIITLIMNPILSKLFGVSYTKATVYQITGCIFFVIAMLLIDDGFMHYFGYHDMDDEIMAEPDYNKANKKRKSSFTRRLTNLVLGLVLLALIASTMVCITAITRIQKTTVRDSTKLGQQAAEDSADALKEELETEMSSQVSDRASLAQSKISQYSDTLSNLSEFATELLTNPSSHSAKEIDIPREENAGTLTMQRTLASQDITYADVATQAGILGNMEEALYPVANSLSQISTMYLGTKDGLMISYDIYSQDIDGDEYYYEFRESNWYQLAQSSDGPVFTDSYMDALGRGMCVTCVAPIYDGNGDFAGAIAMDILTDDLNQEIVSNGIDSSSQAYLVSQDGNLLTSDFYSEESESLENIFDTDSDSLAVLHEYAKQITSEDSGILEYGKGNDAVYLAFAKVESTGWRICITSPVAQIMQPADTIKEKIDENTTAVSTSVNTAIHNIIQNCLILFALLLLIITYAVGRATNHMVQPLKSLEHDVRQISLGNLSHRSSVESTDEIGILAKSFNDMTDALEEHIKDLKEVTAKEERIASELSMAAEIQAYSLPNDFPAFPEHQEFDIYASMTPAKEVGGDFYDFFKIDENHLGLVMADVSGKGMPAALFMMISKMLLKHRTQMGGKPSEILSDANNQICQNNKADMFVTVWLGILDIQSGEITAANAGHEYPAIKDKSGHFSLLHDRHGLVLGAMDGMKYKDYTIQLEAGDALFLYTDGVPEATRSDDTMYGSERMINALNASQARDPKELLQYMEKDVDSFVKDADQFDDLTMLGFFYKGSNKTNK